eukprot:4614955-Pleurochrysis_carterae.AAC.1
MDKGTYRPLWLASSTIVGAEFRAQPADLHSTPSTRSKLRYKLDLGASCARTHSKKHVVYHDMLQERYL